MKAMLTVVVAVLTLLVSLRSYAATLRVMTPSRAVFRVKPGASRSRVPATRTSP